MSQHCCDVATLDLVVLKPSVNVVVDVATFLVQCRDIELVSPPWLVWSDIVTSLIRCRDIGYLDLHVQALIDVLAML